MKNVLGAIALAALGSFALAASANASPAASLAGLGEQTAPAAEKVTFRHRFYGYWGHKRHFYYGGYGYWWRKHCYFHPYHWQCRRFY